MNNLKLSFFIMLFSHSLMSFGQDPVRLKAMTYNLLNYRSYPSYCPSSSNNPIAKEGYLNEIVNYIDPHLLVCNELDGYNSTAHSRILTHALNINGETRWEKTDLYTNGSSLVNGIYFDKNILGLKSQGSITKDISNQNLVRAIDVCEFYYKDSLLSIDPDTIFFTLFAAHFKAGSSSSDINARDQETKAIMAYINANSISENYFLAGDLNMKKSQEIGFQNLLNYSVSSIRFYDPENQPGNWNNNYTFRNLHSQSTRNGATNSGCFAGGGLDDRFDHWLFNDDISSGNSGISYISGSLSVTGNDGLHFNNAINSPTNNSVPSNILTALYEMSDHLPVTIELDIERLQIGKDEYLNMPARAWTDLNGTSWLSVSQSSIGGIWYCTDMLGRIIKQGVINETQFVLPALNSESGLVLIRIKNRKNQTRTIRLPL